MELSISFNLKFITKSMMISRRKNAAKNALLGDIDPDANGRNFFSYEDDPLPCRASH